MWYSWRKMYLNTTFIFMQCLIILQETNEVQYERKESALQYSLRNEPYGIFFNNNEME